MRGVVVNQRSDVRQASLDHIRCPRVCLRSGCARCIAVYRARIILVGCVVDVHVVFGLDHRVASRVVSRVHGRVDEQVTRVDGGSGYDGILEHQSVFTSDTFVLLHGKCVVLV